MLSLPDPARPPSHRDRGALPPRAMLAVVGCCVAAVVGAELLLERAPVAAAALSLAYHWLYAAAVVLCLLAARRTATRREALAWRAMALGTASILVSIALMYVTRQSGIREPQWLGDLLALLFYPAASVALLALGPPSDSSARRLRVILDLLLCAAAVTTLVAYAWIHRVETFASTQSWMMVYVLLTPAAVFLVLLPAIYAALWFERGRTHPAHVALLVAVLASVVTDSVWITGLGGLALRFSYWGWTLAIALLATAAYLQCRVGPRPPPAATRRVWRVRVLRLLPYAAVAAAAAALAVEVSGARELAMRVLGYGLTASLVLLLVRQVLLGRENRKLQDARLAQDARFRMLVQRSSDALVVVTPEGCIDYHSESLARVIGAGDAGAAFVGRRVEELVAERDRPALQQALARVVESASYAPVLVARPASDPARAVEVLLGNRLDDDAIGGVVLTLRDVTERRALETQLWQAQKLDAVGRLAGGVAHDFSNILTTILTGAELLEAGLASGAAGMDEVREIRQAATRASALTRQLLAFAQPRAAEPTLVLPSMALTGIDRMLRRLLGADVELSMTVDPDACCVRLGPGHLEQVLVNLVTNARDAMRDGGSLTIEIGSVTLDGSSGAPPGDYLLLSVRDTGLGMDAETRSRMFEPFFTTKEVGKGTGLGLATVYGIVRQAEGHVTVESELGVGTTFRVYLPRAYDLEEQATPETHPAPARAAQAGGRASGTILLVEDEPAVLNLASRALRGMGYDVLAAEDGRAALALLEARSTRIDLLVTDVVMPRMSGGQLAESLRRHDATLPVLFLTAHHDDPRIADELRRPATALLPKPFTAQQLGERVGALRCEV